MRFALVVVALAACSPEKGVVHDGSTDIVLTAQYAEGDCGPRGDYIEVNWEIPDGAKDITVTLCNKEYIDDTGGEQCGTTPAEDMTREVYPPEPAIRDGYLWFKCGGYYPTTWRIDYTAPRP
jgi:hypothetical protein